MAKLRSAHEPRNVVSSEEGTKEMNDGVWIISTAHPISDEPMKRKRDAKGRFMPWISEDSLVHGEIDFSGPPIGLKVFARGRRLLDKEQKK